MALKGKEKLTVKVKGKDEVFDVDTSARSGQAQPRARSPATATRRKEGTAGTPRG